MYYEYIIFDKDKLTFIVTSQRKESPVANMAYSMYRQQVRS